LLDDEMNMKSCSTFLGIFLVAGALFAAEPYMGTWKLNESKSKFTAGTAKNTTVTYSSTMMGKVKVTTDGTDGAGKPSRTSWTGKFDGKDYALSGDPMTDTRAYAKVNDRTLQLTGKKGGKVVNTARVVVSADGKSRTVTINGTNAKGKKFKNTAVYDKE
jgi:hypothetical protein